MLGGRVCQTPGVDTNGSERLLHHEELQVPDCSPRRAKGCLELVDWTSYWAGILEWLKVL